MNQNRFLKLLASAGSIVVLATATVNLPAIAQDFGGVSGSGSSGSSGSRGGCPATPKPLTALVPKASGQGGLTVAARPTVWVYVPYALTSEKTIEVVLQDEQGSDVYKTRFQGTGASSGVVSLTLPSDQPALTVDKAYRWYFSVYCGKVSDRPSFATGWVKRVDLDPALKKQLEGATPQKRSSLYAEHLLWYDAITVLGEGMRTNASNQPLLASWAKLMQLPSVGLGNFATEPLTPCCSLTSGEVKP